MDNSILFREMLERSRLLIKSDPQLQATVQLPDKIGGYSNCSSSNELLHRICELYKDRPALGWRKDGSTQVEFETISYGAFWKRICSFAAGLIHRDMVRDGEAVCIFGNSTVDFFVAEFSCNYVGAVSVPVSPGARPEELSFIIRETRCRTVFLTESKLALLLPILRKFPQIENFVVLDFQSKSSDIPHISELESLGEYKKIDYRKRSAQEPISICFTSGSTGSPKGAIYHEKSWFYLWSHEMQQPPLNSVPYISYSYLPPSHMAGRVAVINAMKAGGTIYFGSQDDFSNLFAEMRSIRPTFLLLIPRISEMIFQHFQNRLSEEAAKNPTEDREKTAARVKDEMRSQFLGDRLLMASTATAPLSAEVVKFLKTCFRIPVFNVYSSTECGHILVDGLIHQLNVIQYKLASVPELGYTLADKPFPRGEMRVKTNRAICGYLNDPEATRQLYDEEGFTRTGDIFKKLPDGRYEWIDRKNNVLKLANGEFVTISKLETFFSASPLIHQIFIHGDSKRAHLLAIIVPTQLSLRDGASLQPGIRSEVRKIANPNRSSSEFLYQGNVLRSEIRLELDRIAKQHQLKSFEVPFEFMIEHEEFSKANGLLNNSNKPARLHLVARYRPILDSIYDRIETDRLEKAGQLISMSNNLSEDELVTAVVGAVLGVEVSNERMSASFRQIGGDSLSAAAFARLIEQIKSIHVSVGFILSPHTKLSDIAARLRSPEGPKFLTIQQIHSNGIAKHTDFRLERFIADFKMLVASGKHFDPTNFDRQSPVYFITGASGFMGRHITLELLRQLQSRPGQVICMMRSRSVEEGLTTLSQTYSTDPKCLEEFQRLSHSKLRVVCGDVDLERFGLSEGEFKSLGQQVTHIVHSAALVNHALHYKELFHTNVRGSAEIFRFALSGNLKSVGFISSSAMSMRILNKIGRAEEAADFKTVCDNWALDADGYANGYGLSKWGAELFALEYAQTFGAPVQVFRCSKAMSHSRFAGQINLDDSLIRMIVSLAKTKLAPPTFYSEAVDGMTGHIDALTVDFISEAIAKLSLAVQPGFTCFHINNTNWRDNISLDRFVDWMNDLGWNIQKLRSYADWYRSFEAALSKLEPQEKLKSIWPLISRWKAPQSSTYGSGIDASAFERSVAELRPASHQSIPSLTRDNFVKIVNDLKLCGLI